MLVDWSFGRYITDLRIIDNLLLISLGSVKQNAMCQSFLLFVAEDLCVIDILPLAEVQKALWQRKCRWCLLYWLYPLPVGVSVKDYFRCWRFCWAVLPLSHQHPLNQVTTTLHLLYMFFFFVGSFVGSFIDNGVFRLYYGSASHDVTFRPTDPSCGLQNLACLQSD